MATGVRRPRLLLAATFAVAVVLTTTCNLDTTAVLFTPLALSVAAAAGLGAVPFALASVLAANFGSLLLPTSNLTNLVLWRSSGLSFPRFAAITAPAAALAALARLAALLIRGPRPPAPPTRPPRRSSGQAGRRQGCSPMWRCPGDAPRRWLRSSWRSWPGRRPCRWRW
ncbi:MAG: SLC13 family permease [Acidimicrobiales bacterium]